MQRWLLSLTASVTLLGLTPHSAPPDSLPPAQDRAVALGDMLAGLGVSARVLMIGAHPDDENTQLLTFLARGRHVETAYLSLTRGDGGQNAIGNELGDALGVIRTEELLAARRLDGAHQYFTRAYDFGFSKTAEETFKHWPKDSILRDVLTVVRAFRPQIIIAVFTGTPADGHGHHQVSGILAREAYDLAGDSVKYPPSTTGGLPAWTPLKIYSRGAGGRGGGGGGGAATGGGNAIFPVGERYVVTGTTYAEISGQSRGQHKSQGFGTGGGGGGGGAASVTQRLERSRVSDVATDTSMFTGIDTTWNRFRAAVPNAGAVDQLVNAIAAARAAFSPSDPSAPIAALGRAQRAMRALCVRDSRCPDGVTPGSAAMARDLEASWAELGTRLNDLVVLASGATLVATAPAELVASGSMTGVQMALRNGGPRPIGIGSYEVVVGSRILTADLAIPIGGGAQMVLPNATRTFSPSVTVTGRGTRPWWLDVPRVGDIFGVPLLPAAPLRPWVHGLIAEDLRPAQMWSSVGISIDSAAASISAPVLSRPADSMAVARPSVIAPAIAVTLDRDMDFAPVSLAYDRTVQVNVVSADVAQRTVTISLMLPPGLTADSAKRTVSLAGGAAGSATFRVRGRLQAGRHTISAIAESNGARFTEGYTLVDYAHIHPQRLYRPAAIGIEALDLAVPTNLTVAYIPGVGDNVAPALQGFGIPITIVRPEDVAATDLSKFGTIVVGPRAYDTSRELVAANPKLFAYVQNGGTMVVQYGQNMNRPGVMPFTVGAAGNMDRVTEEDATVTILDPTSPLLNAPNKIGAADFAGWIQERATYMPRTRDPAYKALLAMNDTGEAPLDGGLLVAPYGKGTYVYATLALFRQLPAGVPGAARLFVNLIAAGHTPGAIRPHP